MKAAVLRMIEAWQANPNRPRGWCVQTPTCSAYGYQAISQRGVIRGGIATTWRVVRCNRCVSGRAG